VSDSARQTVSWVRRLAVGKDPRRTLLRALAIGLFATLFFKFVFLPMRVAGSSMEPTYASGQLNFINRVAYLWKPPARGDVVAIRMAGASIMLMKRVVGLPGERIAMRDGIVYINGRPMTEPYVKQTGDWTLNEFLLGPDEYFFVGDNRAMRRQEHVFGVAQRRRIAGKVLY